MAGLPCPLKYPPAIFFRVECHDENSRVYNSTFQELDMVARDPKREISRQASDDCLSWKHVGTPFIPFTSSWERALRLKRRLITKGENDIVIVAVLAKRLLGVYDAYEVAMALGYREYGQDKRRQLSAHLDEYLVWGGISAETDRILAFFDCQGNQEANIEFSVPGLLATATFPRVFMTGSGRTAAEKLKSELYQRTGIRGDSEQFLYLVGYMVEIFNPRFPLPFTVIQMH